MRESVKVETCAVNRQLMMMALIGFSHPLHTIFRLYEHAEARLNEEAA